MPRNLINQKCWHRRVSACAVGMCFRHVPCVQGRFASTPCFIVFPRGLSMRFKVLVDRISKPAALLEDKSHSTCDTTILQLAMPPRHGILLHMIYKELNFTGLNSWQECDLPRCLHSFRLLKLWRIWPRLSARKSLNSHSWQFSGVRLAFHQHEQSLQGQPRREFQTNDTKLDMHGGVAQQSQGGAIGHCSFSTENFLGVWRRLRKASRRAHTHTDDLLRFEPSSHPQPMSAGHQLWQVQTCHACRPPLPEPCHQVWCLAHFGVLTCTTHWRCTRYLSKIL